MQRLFEITEPGGNVESEMKPVSPPDIREAAGGRKHRIIKTEELLFLMGVSSRQTIKGGESCWILLANFRLDYRNFHSIKFE